MRLLPMGRMQRGPVGLDELDRWVLIRWERRPALMTSGSGLATSLGWQHLTAIEQSCPRLPALTAENGKPRR
ncbi:MAG: hypothetical protein K0R13_1570 [Propionibacteriaceae bacterium]|jgi:hypothetical protein|nr:hypothetical protein [Propionibacteriaceae bacterium]